MDTRKPMAEVAQALLLTEEMGHARAAKLLAPADFAGTPNGLPTE